MNCPNCTSAKTKVIDSRPLGYAPATRRRIKCKCGHRFTTYETTTPPEAPMPLDEIRTAANELGEMLNATADRFNALQDAINRNAE